MEPSLSTYTVLMLILDCIIVFLLILIYSKSRRKEFKQHPEEIEKMENLQKALSDAIQDTQHIADAMLKSFDQRITKIREYMSFLEEIRTCNDRSFPYNTRKPDHTHKPSISSSKSASVNPYKLARELLMKGTNRDEIHKKSGLGYHEIDLIQKLTRNSSEIQSR